MHKVEGVIHEKSTVDYPFAKTMDCINWVDVGMLNTVKSELITNYSRIKAISGNTDGMLSWIKISSEVFWKQRPIALSVGLQTAICLFIYLVKFQIYIIMIQGDNNVIWG